MLMQTNDLIKKLCDPLVELVIKVITHFLVQAPNLSQIYILDPILKESTMRKSKKKIYMYINTLFYTLTTHC